MLRGQWQQRTGSGLLPPAALRIGYAYRGTRAPAPGATRSDSRQRAREIRVDVAVKPCRELRGLALARLLHDLLL